MFCELKKKIVFGKKLLGFSCMLDLSVKFYDLFSFGVMPNFIIWLNWSEVWEEAALTVVWKAQLHLMSATYEIYVK